MAHIRSLGFTFSAAVICFGLLYHYSQAPEAQAEPAQAAEPVEEHVLDVFLPRDACRSIVSQSLSRSWIAGRHDLDVLCQSSTGVYTGFFVTVPYENPDPRRIVYHRADQDEMTVAHR